MSLSVIVNGVPSGILPPTAAEPTTTSAITPSKVSTFIAPYEISCIEDLVAFSNMTNGKGIKFENGELVKLEHLKTSYVIKVYNFRFCHTITLTYYLYPLIKKHLVLNIINNKS